MRLQKKKRLLSFLAIAFLTIPFLSSLLNVKPVSSAAARLSTDPPILNAALGESFSVNISVFDVAFLYAWQVNMSFDPNVLEFVNVTEGAFLKQQPDGTYLSGLNKEVPGWVFFGWTTLGSYVGESGSGNLATVEFQVLANGESALKFENRTGLISQRVPGFPPLFEDISFSAEDGLFTNTVTPPVADFTYSPLIPGINETITFDASASSPAALLVITEYFWDFGDGTNATVTTPTVEHNYTTGGIYTASLTVFDNAPASELVKSHFNETDTRAQMGLMPRIWYELYGTKETIISIAFPHDVAVTNVAISKTEVTAGETVSINVTVLNKGLETEDFSVTAYYGTNEIGTQQVEGLIYGEEKALIFSWDTTGVAEGEYQIKAVASEVEGEGNVEDNEFIDGTVRVVVGSESFPTTLIIIGGAIGAGVVLVILFLFLRRRSAPTT